MMSQFPSIPGVPSTNRNTVILSSISQPPSYPFNDYVPFPGTDVSIGIDILPIISIDGCNTRCTLNIRCVGFVTRGGDDCYMKPELSNPIHNSLTSAYFRVLPRRQYTVYNNLDFYVENISYYGKRNECNQACDALPKCVGYVILI